MAAIMLRVCEGIYHAFMDVFWRRWWLEESGWGDIFWWNYRAIHCNNRIHEYWMRSVILKTFSSNSNNSPLSWPIVLWTIWEASWVRLWARLKCKLNGTKIFLIVVLFTEPFNDDCSLLNYPAKATHQQTWFLSSNCTQFAWRLFAFFISSEQCPLTFSQFLARFITV